MPHKHVFSLRIKKLTAILTIICKKIGAEHETKDDIHDFIGGGRVAVLAGPKWFCYVNIDVRRSYELIVAKLTKRERETMLGKCNCDT